MDSGNRWNWQRADWPNFRFEETQLAALEAEFLRQSGVFAGALRHVGEDDKKRITVELIQEEAFCTSEIEGEILNRESLQSSIRRNFGLATDDRRIPPAEQGIAEMMVDLYRNFAAPLSHSLLFRWQQMLLSGRRDLVDIGQYRTSEQPMQVLSGPLHNPRVHFEAPPFKIISSEMTRFVDWFNQTAPGGETPLPALTRASLTHWYFVSIHPFEDGNGRIARALAEKAISQGLNQPTLLALSREINNHRKAYYDILERSNTTNEISAWMGYFARTLLEAQAFAQRAVDFLIEKTKFFDRFRGQLNERQEKVLVRMFREGPAGFQGGLSAAKYAGITGTSRATVTRDLQDLFEKKALTRTGELKGTRYYLNVPGVSQSHSQEVT